MSVDLLYLLRKYPLLRVACCLAVVSLSIGVSLLVFSEHGKAPEIAEISPQIGVPGSIMRITGSGFGDQRDASFVEIGGSSLTSSSYLSWTSSEIRVQLPANVQDGLVYVVTRRGRSQPVIFANRENIPVAINQMETQRTLPVITSETPQRISVGQVLTITGSNFGSIRGENSCVYFTPGWKPDTTGDMEQLDRIYIRAQDSDYDYEFWSDTEIRVRVPDGAASGGFFVQTDKGESNQRTITVSSAPGAKSFPDKRTYLLQLTADISEVDMGANSMLTLRIPRPQQSASQHGVAMTECNPPPVFEDYNKSVIHQVHSSQTKGKKIPFTQTFVVPVHSVSTEVDPDKVQGFSDTSRVLYKIYTEPDECVPSGQEAVIDLSKKIVERETNPYRQARRIYDYMLDNYRLLHQLLPKEVPSLNLLASLQGDAYDYAIIFTALCRAAGIPAIPVSGVLVDNAKNSRNHWWAEIYLENFGWLPVDVAMAAGLGFSLSTEPENRREFYFGNMDFHHVAFSRGWNKVNPTIITNKTVFRPKTYGLQSIWEEATSGTINYSSFWSDPVVLGIY